MNRPRIAAWAVAVALLPFVRSAPACDVTGWPSATHHPSPVKTVAAMTMFGHWEAGDGVFGDTVRSAIRTNLPGASVYVAAGRLEIVLPASVTDWTGVRSIVAGEVPTARFAGITVRIMLPKHGAPPDAERMLTAMPGLTLARISMERDSVRIQWPPDLPYPAAAVWRARRYLAIDAGG